MKSKKSTIFYAIAIILLSLVVIISGYFAKGEWLKGQLGQVIPLSSGNITGGSGAPAK